ncbi:hypothetical protein DBR11_04095 [Pedobacter sp. HMWF019]|uniref:family 43 glycosylhydrolase n=1 Tax=Pedobacter sp. HMWF019 TaxID=2056856 RepID=UPI000D34D38B|nr:family 43 glycosylhydrolase [Pedobacter sp. HMWF019]PTT02763.1 hypothetical protein DBR11_04095 [Pedobacter sp. HMWF019]
MNKRITNCIDSLLITLLTLAISLNTVQGQIKNFDKNGGQITRFNTVGDAVDAHDGEISHFNGIYYLYGTSYDCGFQWGNKTAPFCGFKVYSSKDLTNWEDRGFLFNANTKVWQSRCDGKTYGCFRPHVLYNKKTKLYVLWINVYDNRIGYRVFTSKSPLGPFKEVAEPHLAVNHDMPAAGLNNGDHDLFVDDNGTAYIAYTDWRTKGSIVIEKLSADYLTGTGEHVKSVTNGETEAPGLFKRNDIYYVVYSDPNCGYCAGTGTSYRTAPSALGPWSVAKKISDNSCGGQPSFVSTIKINSETVYLYGSDLWNNAAKNEALANFYWAPLTFAADGSIQPLKCYEAYKAPKASPLPKNKYLDSSSGIEDFSTKCDIGKQIQRSQSFTASRSGKLIEVTITCYKIGAPDADLTVEVYHSNTANKPTGKALYTKLIPVDSIGWSAKNVRITPNLQVKKDQQYAVVLRSNSSSDCYGFAFNDFGAYTQGKATISTDNGKTFKLEENRTLKFQTFIKSYNRSFRK